MQKKGSHVPAKSIKVPVLGIVENMAIHQKNYPTINTISLVKMETPFRGPTTKFLGEVPLVQSIRESGDVGHPVALQKDTPLEKAFNEITKEIVSELLKRNANLPPTEVVRITTMSGCSAVKK